MMMMIRGSYGQEFSVLFSWLTVYTSYWLAAAIPGRLVLGRFSTRVFQCGRSQWSVYGANKPAGGIVWRRSPTSAWVTSSRATTFGSPTRSGRRRSRRPRRCRTKNRLSPAGYGQPPIVPRCDTSIQAAGVAWWRNGMASDLRSRGREFDPRPRRGYVMTLGKLFTPNCLDADTLR